MLRARHGTFIERNHWDLPQVDGMEFDQYDTPASRWVAVQEFGLVRPGCA
jgi:N-acyl-L-homoserine lactone synthetase